VLPTRARAAGVLSLILWVSIPVCGRLIAYYEPDESKAPQKATEAHGANVDKTLGRLEYGLQAGTLEAPHQPLR